MSEVKVCPTQIEDEGANPVIPQKRIQPWAMMMSTGVSLDSLIL